jgi:hypothetical protein
VPTTRKPDVIVREIEQTRAELADTIDAITGRINPRRAASRGARAVREQVASVRDRATDDGPEDTGAPAGHIPDLGATPRTALLAFGAVVAVVGLMLIRRRR